MTENEVPHPRIASRQEWQELREEHLDHEKALTKLRDRVAAERRLMPMVKVEKRYEFDTPAGKKGLLDLFEGRQQLIVYHFMFDPSWDKGCPGCTSFVDALGDLSMLNERNTTFTLISRAPLEKLEKYKAERKWDRAWASSFGSDFNYDFHVTLDEAVAPIDYNYRDKAAWIEHDGKAPSGEMPGLSVFFRLGDEVFHTYSTYQRGVEALTDAYPLLDCTPYGRQEDWEDSPPGWPQKPTYG